jgi:hypothetical protein
MNRRSVYLGGKDTGSPEPKMRPPRHVIPSAVVHLADTLTVLANISHTGLAIRVDYPLRVGQQWSLVIETRGSNITVNGRVVRCTAVEGVPGRFIVGFSFVDLSHEDRLAIDTLCDKRI